MPHTNPYPLNPEPSLAALPYNSALSLWLSVDPLSDKYPNLSPYVYCADNPVRLVDVDGREVRCPGVIMFYLQLNGGAGVGKAVSAKGIGGMAIDKGGRTFFFAASANYITNQDFSATATSVGGFWGIGLGAGVSVSYNWKAKSFSDAAKSQSTSLSGGLGLGLGVSFGGDHVGFSAGVDVGGGIDVSNMQIVSSLSVSKSEMRSIATPNTSWEVKNQKPIYNDKKKKIGYSGTVYTHNSNGESKSTGIIVRSGLDEKGRSNGQWTSKQYRENLN